MSPADADKLLQLSRDVAHRAYAPYSKFHVGAVVVDEDGNTFVGVNVENAAYGSGQCAEASAVSGAVSAGAGKLVAIAVSSPNAAPCWPCGNCRQILREFEVETVIVEASDRAALPVPLAELLPNSFGPDDIAGASV
ncbi:MAG: cytidine deaminase [Acidobacteria bacterium]|nr:cytidine deaminase [Acidobacteriota bacterium]